LLSLVALLICASLSAQQIRPAASSQQGDQPVNSTEDLQKAAQNPVAELSSVRFRTTAISG
jgi:hypothetical protein